MKIDPARIHKLNSTPIREGTIVYWMSREQRVADNWGLLHAQQIALELTTPLTVVFTLADNFLGAPLRHYSFMLSALRDISDRLSTLGIDMALLQGDPPETMIELATRNRIGAIITDFDPLRIKRQWFDKVAATTNVAVIEVDSHNIVPCRFVSEKQEYGAYTIRPKIHRLLDRFLTDIPVVLKHPHRSTTLQSSFIRGIDPELLISSLNVDRSVGEVSITSGEQAAVAALHNFICNGIERYGIMRNDPNADAQSGLSPYLHFGQLAPQRAALEVARACGGTASADAFLEELIIRRELSDNYCLHNSNYDNLNGFPEWGRKTIEEHRFDRREYSYSSADFANAATHDFLWNAAQTELTESGKMHGYMRMYWCKKILEWSASPEEAIATAIHLNDRYSIDGRDPNGYAGIAWSIGGVHDRAWFERPVFGKIRYMNQAGCRRKFDVNRYIRRWSLLNI